MGVIFDPLLGQLRTADAGGGGTGTVASVSVVTANGVSGTVANPTTTPAITLALGAITPTSVNSIVLSGSATPTLAVNGTSSISGANTGDQTITLTGAVTGSGTGSFATTIATPGTLTVSSTNSTVTAHTHAITSSSAPGIAASLLATDASGIIGNTTTRIVKGWFTDLTVTNAIAGSVTGNAATVTTNANLTGVITSVGNATSIASQTGTGTKFVVDTSPVLVTPTLGVATATSINKVTITAPATSSTLTVANGSSLITAGAFALTLTSTATSNATIPSGTNTLYSTKSGSITSAQLATSLTDDTGSGSAVFATSPTLTTPVISSIVNTGTLTLPTSTGTIATLQTVYQIGCIYIETTGTNPNTTFGFGTWVAYAQGQVLVGKATSGTFATAGATGGEETHVLTSTEMPSHTHTYNTDSTVAVATGWTDGNPMRASALAYTLAHSVTNTGGGGAHNNLQPYIVVYIWTRTA
jgi:microcystin-dependent protein